MDIYQIATAYWDQVYEEKEAKDSQRSKNGGLKVPRLRNNISVKSINLENLKPAR